MIVDYLAIAGEDRAISELLQQHGANLDQCLKPVLNQPGLALFAASETPILFLEGQRGAVIGRLFRSANDRARIVSLGEQESQDAQGSGGQWLIDHCWGNYVALLGAGPELVAVRDPSAAVPAYCRERAGFHIYCSDFALAKCFTGKADVDEEFIRQWLSFPFLRTARTGLSKWREILPGTSHSSAGETKSLWTPARAARETQRTLDFDEAAGLVRRTALATIGRLAADVPEQALELSGGLDSSIVAACLHAGGIEFGAFNFATRQPDGDERHYAKLVAAHFAVTLSELEEDDSPLELEPPRHRPPSGREASRSASDGSGGTPDRALQDFVSSPLRLLCR